MRIDSPIDEFKDFNVPKYDLNLVKTKTYDNPYWIHFGAGNLFRAFHANIVERLLNEKELDRGLIVAEGYDYEIVEKMYWPYDNRHILVTLKADGSVSKSLIASVCESLVLDEDNENQINRLKEIFTKDSLQMATFTITEKGYSLNNQNVYDDFLCGPCKPVSYLGKVASLLYERYLYGQKPIAMVSTDNCSHNGDKLYEAMNAFATNWAKNNKVEKGFVDYVNDKSKVSFPWSMIDKITPRPDKHVKEMLSGIEGIDGLVTSKNTYIAPFVNSEESEYLVIEDWFPNGRPNLEKAGVLFTDRETVDKVEKMKVCTCLNPLHTSLAIFGCLLGYQKIADEMKDADLVNLIKTIGYKEGLKVVVDPKILNPKEFIDTVINVRLVNPFMPDTPQRIACDTSQKLAIRFGETIKSYVKNGYDLSELKLIPLVFAGWLRYLMAIDDNGEQFELSPDPLLNEACPYVKNLKLGDSDVSCVKPLLENEKIFGVNLYDAGLADSVLSYFKNLIKDKGAVRDTLHKAVC